MKTEKELVSCECEGETEDVDSFLESRTVRCVACRRATLVARHANYELVIPLRSFHRTRGSKSGQRRFDDWSMATNLWRCLVDLKQPSPAAVVDFGIRSRAHFDALRHAVRQGISAYELDRVLGDGPAITQLVNGIPEQPELGIQFHTEYDDVAFWRGPKNED